MVSITKPTGNNTSNENQMFSYGCRSVAAMRFKVVCVYDDTFVQFYVHIEYANVYIAQCAR